MEVDVKKEMKKSPEIYCPCGWQGMFKDLRNTIDKKQHRCPDCERLLFENGKAVKLDD